MLSITTTTTVAAVVVIIVILIIDPWPRMAPGKFIKTYLPACHSLGSTLANRQATGYREIGDGEA